MSAFPVMIGIGALGYVVWRGFRSRKPQVPGPANNWQNEDYASRKADGTWTDGSTHTKSEPTATPGIGTLV